MCWCWQVPVPAKPVCWCTASPFLSAQAGKPARILALAYNRHAAVDIRRRLAELIGDDARGVTVLTCHALAMRLAGASFCGQAERPDDQMFQEVIRRAVQLLRGEGLPPEEADEQRERLLAGFRWILVDEYQDIGKDQYELIAALAGRTLDDEDRKLTLFAVGDDDQNIYAFNRRFGGVHPPFRGGLRSRKEHLTDNYRSTAHIIAAANAVIEPAGERMKTGHPIRGRPGARQRTAGRRVGRARPRIARACPDSARRKQSGRAGAGGFDGVPAARGAGVWLGLVDMRGDRARVGVSGPGAGVLRAA